MENLLTPLQAAAALGVSRPRIYQLMKDGTLERQQVGEFAFVTRESVERLVEARSQEPKRSVAR